MLADFILLQIFPKTFTVSYESPANQASGMELRPAIFYAEFDERAMSSPSVTRCFRKSAYT